MIRERLGVDIDFQGGVNFIFRDAGPDKQAGLMAETFTISRAAGIYQLMLDAPQEWILCDQVLFEFYRALRNPRILDRPLGHQQELD